jgi:arginyl-tRNA synthetase
VIEEGLAKGIFYRKEDSSVWIDLTDDGLDHKLVLRSDGTAVYMTQDIGTAILRFKDYPAVSGMIYTVGNEQDYHFKVLFLILKKLGYQWAQECHHLSYGMVDLPSGKMKSREGTVVDADELVHEMIATARERTKELGKIDELSIDEAEKLFHTIGLGALKYFILKVDPRKRMLFDPNESIDFHGNTGPFIQYTHARISAIERRAKILEVNESALESIESYQFEKEEVEVAHLLLQGIERLGEAARDYSPAIICQFIYELAKTYNRFYTEHSIFGAKSTEQVVFRVVLSMEVAKQLKFGLGLLGIEAPDRM